LGIAEKPGGSHRGLSLAGKRSRYSVLAKEAYGNETRDWRERNAAPPATACHSDFCRGHIGIGGTFE
jgi:hypothetical protein